MARRDETGNPDVGAVATNNEDEEEYGPELITKLEVFKLFFFPR